MLRAYFHCWNGLTGAKKLLVISCLAILSFVVPMFFYAIWLGVDFSFGWPEKIGLCLFGTVMFSLSDNPAFRVFFGSKKWWLVAFSGLFVIVGLLILSVMFAREWTDWMFAFGDIMQKGAKSVTDWPELICEITWIVFIIGAIEVSIGIMSRWYLIIWRIAWMQELTEPWLLTGTYIDGAAQTFTDIINQYTQKMLDYFNKFFRAYSVMCVFGPKLWYVNESFKIPYFMNIPGALVYVTIAIAAVSVLGSYFCSLRLKECQETNYNNEKKTRSAYEKFELKKPEPEDVIEAKKDILYCVEKLKQGYVWYAVHFLLYDVWTNWYAKFWAIAPVAFFGMYVTNLQASYGAMSQALSIVNEFHGSIIFLAFLWADFQTYRVLRDNLINFAKALKPKSPPPPLLRRERRRAH